MTTKLEKELRREIAVEDRAEQPIVRPCDLSRRRAWAHLLESVEIRLRSRMIRGMNGRNA